MGGDWLKDQKERESVEQYYGKSSKARLSEIAPKANRANQDKPLTVHFVPHSHMDAGWHKTPDEYYTGQEDGFVRMHASCETIFEAVLDELSRDPRRKFAFADIKFLSMWLKKLSEEKRRKFKDLVASGQIDIVQGSWVSTDEATTNYEDMILNMHIGHAFLYGEYGIRPRVGWMVDEFGHSAANAALYSDFGLEALIMSRKQDDMKIEAEENKELSFVWKPFSRHFGNNKEIMTHITVGGYEGPDGVLHNDIERTDTSDE